MSQKSHDLGHVHLLPLVSVVVVNYNYASFLELAVRSVAGQTYKNIEIILIDDKSTDDSGNIIAELLKRFPHIRYIPNQVNLGQSASILKGIEYSSGAYCIFLDSDDFLMPDCVMTHVETHLSLRQHVGFTSVDMLQISEGKVVTVGSPGFQSAINKNHRPLWKRHSTSYIRDDQSLPENQNESLVEDIYLVPREDSGGWPWSPTSGNCFRRDALQLIIHNAELPSLRSCTDCYLLRGVASLTGSVLINRALAGYRLHPKNAFTKAGMLWGFIHYNPADLTERSEFATKMLLRFLVKNALDISQRMESKKYFCDAIDALDTVYPCLDLVENLDYASHLMLQNQSIMIRSLGHKTFWGWMSRRLNSVYKIRKRYSAPLSFMLAKIMVYRLRHKSYS